MTHCVVRVCTWERPAAQVTVHYFHHFVPIKSGKHNHETRLQSAQKIQYFLYHYYYTCGNFMSGRSSTLHGQNKLISGFYSFCLCLHVLYCLSL